MVGGLEKYYQLARCYRDEDLRADRQPEHTQLDVEMSFVTQDDVLQLIEELYTSLVQTVKPGFKMVRPFPRLTYADSMLRYATDRPDLRYGLEIADVTDIAAGTDFAVFKTVVSAGGRVRGLAAPGCGGYTRNQLERFPWGRREAALTTLPGTW
jgi:aspartyl-tRNA synthetase